MKILVVGAAGAIGRVVCDELGSRHDIITAGRSSGDIRADMADLQSVREMYRRTGALDAVVSAAGEVQFARLADYTVETLQFGVQQKLMGQVNLVLAGFDLVAGGGSFTLTSGILNRDPVLNGVSSAASNGALDGFVKAAALDMPKRQRINVVSPGLLSVSKAQYGYLFPGHETVSSERVGLAYAKCVEGAATGQVVTVD